MFKAFGLGLLVIAVALAAVPPSTDCQSQGRQMILANGNAAPIKCHWTGVAEGGVAAPMFVVGAS